MLGQWYVVLAFPKKFAIVFSPGHKFSFIMFTMISPEKSLTTSFITSHVSGKVGSIMILLSFIGAIKNIPELFSQLSASSVYIIWEILPPILVPHSKSWFCFVFCFFCAWALYYIFPSAIILHLHPLRTFGRQDVGSVGSENMWFGALLCDTYDEWLCKTSAL